MGTNNPAWWIAGLGVVTGLAAYYGMKLKSEDQTAFLPGETTHGHYQIEMSCETCHTPMNGVKEESCMQCHEADLKAVNDSHPKSKFTDPRNADRVAVLDARNCLTCHKEHVPKQTHAMGLTLPEDYCFYCHENIGEERATHKNLTFDTCATAGCHNYHDNSGLYEAFLAKHLDQKDIDHDGATPQRDLIAFLTRTKGVPKGLTTRDADAPAHHTEDPDILKDWAETAHAAAGVNCTDYHSREDDSGKAEWTNSTTTHENCSSCHQLEVEGFLKGKHGMRLAVGLPPMTPGMARKPMKHSALHEELSCRSCHDGHRFDTRTAAVDSCLRCHDDGHSLAFQQSPHYALLQEELSGSGAAGSGVTCATCHMPRIETKDKFVDRVLVQHNQNFNLQPNERMIRTVCSSCHGVGFSIDALADPILIQNNFNGRPSLHIESMDWVKERTLEARSE